MENNIFNKHHTIGLKFFGAWPGVSSMWGFYSFLALGFSLLFFAFWDLFVVYDDLEAFSDNLISTIGTIGVVLKLISFRLKRR